jgi:hypothetical protein
MYLENTIYYNIYDNDYVSRYRSDDVMYSKMREVSNRLERMDNGRSGGGEGGGNELYYDVAYKEERPYSSKNILKNNYTLYDELLMDHNTMYNMKNSNANMNMNVTMTMNTTMKSVIRRIKELMCCI